MTAAENLARWREAEQGATEGPWHLDVDGVAGVYTEAAVSATSKDVAQPFYGAYRAEDDAFIATARTALPALLTAIEEILTLCDRADAAPIDGLRKVHTASIRQAIERRLEVA